MKNRPPARRRWSIQPIKMFDATKKVLKILRDSGYRVAKAPHLREGMVKFFAHDQKRGIKIQIDEESRWYYGTRAVLIDKVTRLSPEIKVDGTWKTMNHVSSDLFCLDLVEYCKQPKDHVSWESSAIAIAKLKNDAAFKRNDLVDLKITEFTDAQVRPDAVVSPKAWEEFDSWFLHISADFSHVNKIPTPYNFSKPMFERIGNEGVRLCRFYNTAKVVGVGTLGKDNRIDFTSSDVPDKDVWFVISGCVASKASGATCGMIVQPHGDSLVFHPLSSGNGKIQRGLKPLTGNFNFEDVTHADEVIIREAIDVWLDN